MPSPSHAAGSVEVLAPPGLEDVNGFRVPSPLFTSSSPASGASHGPIGPSKSELKEELVREVTAAVREHIEWKTAESVESLWQKGQRAMTNLQQQQLNQTTQLQSQLLACTEAHQQLQRENAMLRSGLEALMKHLTLIFGPPPHLPGAPPSANAGRTPPIIPPAAAPRVPQRAQTPQSATPSQTGAGTKPSTSKLGSEAAEDFHTPAGSPLRGEISVAEDLAGGPSPNPALSPIPGLPARAPPSASGTRSDAKVPASVDPIAAPAAASAAQPAQAPTFSLTLRRADNVPLGLDVVGEPDKEWLVVEGIRLGGAVEAWNRQCHGDSREIRRGDRIIQINAVKDADSMRVECLEKHLLRMSVLRISKTEQAAPTVVTEISAASPGIGGLRAEADEFVPQAKLRTSATC